MSVVDGRLHCDKCAEPIDRPGDAWWEVVAYARRGTKSGFNHFTLAQATDMVMCNACMLRAKMQSEHGPNPSLF